jgi:hypothetical protein
MPAPSDALAVPWPVFAFGAAPIGLLIGAIAAGIVLLRKIPAEQPRVRDSDRRCPLARSRRLRRRDSRQWQ